MQSKTWIVWFSLADNSAMNGHGSNAAVELAAEEKPCTHVGGIQPGFDKKVVDWS